MLNVINELSIALGLGKCLQQDTSTDPVSYAPLFERNLDCTLYSDDNRTFLLNLAVTHINTIGFCYIDPPYNTGSNFLYNDVRKSSSRGIFGKHSAWMQFMLPRLISIREMLREDGAIAVSIDDYEHPYLIILMNHIFGEENFIGNIIVCRSKNGKGSKKNIASSHEYLVVYGKSKETSLRGAQDTGNKYDKHDEYGKYRIDGLFRKKGEASLRSDRPNMYYPIYYDGNGRVYLCDAPGLKAVFPVDSRGVERRWLWSKETAKLRSRELFASRAGTIYVKNYFSPEKRTKIRTLWNDSAYFTERATNEVKNIYGDKVFDTPKPITYLKDILDQMSKPDDFILDCFAGSGTTAHAAFELNSEDGGSRKVILMESDAYIPEGHLARKAGFEKLSEITMYRLTYMNQIDDKYSFQVVCEKGYSKECVGRARKI